MGFISKFQSEVKGHLSGLPNCQQRLAPCGEWSSERGLAVGDEQEDAYRWGEEEDVKQGEVKSELEGESEL